MSKTSETCRGGACPGRASQYLLQGQRCSGSGAGLLLRWLCNHGYVHEAPGTTHTVSSFVRLKLITLPASELPRRLSDILWLVLRADPDTWEILNNIEFITIGVWARVF